MIHILPLSERPRERCLAQGASCLSLRECIALLLGTGPRGKGCLGLAAEILGRFGNSFGEVEEERAFFLAMETQATTHLKGISGLGAAAQARILAAFELGRRYAMFRQKSKKRTFVRKSELYLPEQAIDKIPIELRSEPKEWLGFVPVYKSGELGEFCVVERGVRTHVNIDPMELFAHILMLRPAAFFLFHNHPSGLLTPSLADVEITEQVRRTSQQLGVCFLGHGIVSTDGERWVLTSTNCSVKS